MPCTDARRARAAPCRSASPPYSKERNSGPSSSQLAEPAWSGRGAGDRREVGGQERVGQLAGDDRLRHDLALGGGAGSAGSGSGSGSLGLAPGGPAAGRSCRSSRVRTTPTASSAEQLEQGGVAGGGLGQDRGDAVEPLEQLAPARASGGSVSALTRARSSRTSRATTWNLVRWLGRDLAALRRGLDLAHGLARTGMMPSSSPARGRAPVARRGTRRTGTALSSLCQADPSPRVGHGVEPTGAGATVLEATRPRAPAARHPDHRGRAPRTSPGPRVTACVLAERRDAGQSYVVARRTDAVVRFRFGSGSGLSRGSRWPIMGSCAPDLDRQGSRPARPARRSRLRAPQRLGCRVRPHPRAGRLPGHRHDQRGHRLGVRGPGRRSPRPRHDARARRPHRGRGGRAGDRGPRGRVRRHRGRGRPHRGPGRRARGGGRQPRGRTGGRLFGIDEAVDRIAAARAAAPSGHLRAERPHRHLLRRRRGRRLRRDGRAGGRYLEAGADCVFVPGVVEEDDDPPARRRHPRPAQRGGRAGEHHRRAHALLARRQAGQPGRQPGPSRRSACWSAPAGSCSTPGRSASSTVRSRYADLQRRFGP